LIQRGGQVGNQVGNLSYVSCKIGGMGISVIIPTLNEEDYIFQAIQSFRRQNPQEIIVVDGGSTDDTLRLASQANRVLTTLPGRARQMNAGAQQAQGEVLLFIHADCTLEEGSLAMIEKALQHPRVMAGCFRMHVTAPGWLFRLVDACATGRVRLTGLAYGDQGLWVRREDFFRLGGFPLLRFMEDVFISKKLRQLGRMEVLPRKIFVSPRRWQKVGLLRQTLRNWTLTGLAAAGIHPDRLARYYPKM
jgi:rSAM/selenodomain-associated transferase 2